MAKLPPLGPFQPTSPDLTHTHALAWCGALSAIVGATLIAVAIALAVAAS